MLTEDGLIIMLDKIERLAQQSARDQDRANLAERDRNARLILREQYDSVCKERNRAIAKIAEWAEYTSQIRAAINAIDPRAIKRKKIVLPKQPAPFDDIPF